MKVCFECGQLAGKLGCTNGRCPNAAPQAEECDWQPARMRDGSLCFSLSRCSFCGREWTASLTENAHPKECPGVTQMRRGVL